MNQYVPLPGRRYIAWCYKAGSAAIRYATQWDRIAAKAPVWEVRDDIREHGGECVLFLRHPLARLRSSWRWWSQQRRFPQPAYGEKPEWERFVDLVLQDRPETRDPHWNPQIPQHTYCGVLVPTAIHRFEEIDRHWSDWCSHPLEARNVTGGGAEEFPTYRLPELESYYAADLDHWYRAGA